MNVVIRKLLGAAAWLARALHLTRAAQAIDGWLQAPADDSVRDAAEPAAVKADEPAPAFEPFLQPRKLEPEPEPEPEPLRVASPAVPAAAAVTAESFTAATHLHDGALCDYKLYMPPGPVQRGRALVVMLHGCTQDADDFAAGTGMNDCAREQGFFVLYPAQSEVANAHRCWNWFKPEHQRRDRGEPAWIAELTRSVTERHAIDPRRVYIAGLSAGGAMAAVVAEAYPDLFAAVGVHSGLPVGAASNVMEALGVMRSGASLRMPWRVMTEMAEAALGTGNEAVLVPTIVFHGDADETVHPRNGEQIISAVVGLAAASGAARTPPPPRVEASEADEGRNHTRTIHHADDGSATAEHWVVHGAGHAWSGGRAAGSFTDADGPDATREMLRFFFDPAREQNQICSSDPPAPAGRGDVTVPSPPGRGDVTIPSPPGRGLG